MTLARLLRLTSIAVITAFALLAGLAGWTLVRWQRAVDTLRLANEQHVLAERLRAELYRQVKEVNDWLFYGDEAAEAPGQPGETLAGFDRELAALEQGAGRERLAELRALEGEVAATDAAVLDLLERGEVGSAHELMERTVKRRLFERFDEALAHLQTYLRSQSVEAVGQIEAATAAAGLILLGIVALAVLQAVGLLLGAHRRVVRPLGRFALAVRRIGEGELDHRLPVERPDELGALAATVNQMAAALDESRARQVRVERLAAVGELAAYLAHNLRNPLASIRSAAQVAREELAAGLPAPVAGLLGDIIETTDRLDGWVGRTLVSIRPLHLRPTAHQVGAILEELVALLRLAASRRRVALRLEVAPALPAARIDREAVEQALASIVTNAIEASPPDGTVTVRAGPEGPGAAQAGGAGAPRLVLTVTDEGPGISEAVRQRLFTPAFSTKGGGRGLGLWLARSVIESHGGTIAFEPAGPAGTVVRIVLPIA